MRVELQSFDGQCITSALVLYTPVRRPARTLRKLCNPYSRSRQLSRGSADYPIHFGVHYFSTN